MSNFGNDGQTDAFDDFSNLASAYIRTYNPSDAEIKHQKIAASKPKEIPAAALQREVSPSQPKLYQAANYSQYLQRMEQEESAKQARQKRNQNQTRSRSQSREKSKEGKKEKKDSRTSVGGSVTRFFRNLSKSESPRWVEIWHLSGKFFMYLGVS